MKIKRGRQREISSYEFDTLVPFDIYVSHLGDVPPLGGCLCDWSSLLESIILQRKGLPLDVTVVAGPLYPLLLLLLFLILCICFSLIHVHVSLSPWTWSALLNFCWLLLNMTTYVAHVGPLSPSGIVHWAEQAMVKQSGRRQHHQQKRRKHLHRVDVVRPSEFAYEFVRAPYGCRKQAGGRRRRNETSQLLNNK